MARDFLVDFTISDSEDSLNSEGNQNKKRASSSRAEVSDAKRIKLRITCVEQFLASGLSLTNFYNLNNRVLKSPPLAIVKDFYKRYSNLANKAQKQAL